MQLYGFLGVVAPLYVPEWFFNTSRITDVIINRSKVFLTHRGGDRLCSFFSRPSNNIKLLNSKKIS